MSIDEALSNKEFVEFYQIDKNSSGYTTITGDLILRVPPNKADEIVRILDKKVKRCKPRFATNWAFYLALLIKNVLPICVILAILSQLYFGVTLDF